MTILEHIGSANLIVTPFILLVLLAVPLLDKKFAPTGRRALWAMVMVGLVWPFAAFITPHRPAVPISVNLPAPAISETATPQFQPVRKPYQLENFDYGAWDTFQLVPKLDQLINDHLGTQSMYLHHDPVFEPAPLQEVLPTTRRLAINFTMPNIRLLHLWLLGMVIFALYQCFMHIKLMCFMKRWQMPVPDDILAVFESEKHGININKAVGLVYVKNIPSTMLTGLLRPTVCLAHTEYTHEELSLIFRHELTHYKHKDLWYKLALVAIRCLYWYNPIVHLMARQACKDLETLCDHATTQGMDIHERKFYSNIILRMAAKPVRSPLTTHISGGKNMMKQRLMNILQESRPSNKKILVMLGAVLLIAGFFIGFNFNRGLQVYKPVSAVTYEPETNPLATPAEETASDDDYLDTREQLEQAGDALQDAIEAEEDLPLIMEEFDASEHTLWHFTIPPGVWQDRINRRSAAGLLPYADNYQQLHQLVFQQPQLVEHVIENITSLIIRSSFDNIRITQGGEQLTIRYYQWLEGQYMLTKYAGFLRLEFSVPYFVGHPRDGYSNFFGSAYFSPGNIIHDGWLHMYLTDTGREASTTIEIIVPEGMMPSIDISQRNGYTYIQDVELRHLAVNTSMGGVQIDNSFISNGRVSVNRGNFEMRDTTFISMSVGFTTGTANINLSRHIDQYSISASTSMGILTLGGERVAPSQLRNPGASSLLVINTSMGNVAITDPYGTTGGDELLIGGALSGIQIGEILTIPTDENWAFNAFMDNLRPRIGIFIMEIDDNYRHLFNLPSTGIMVTDVVPGSGAEAAGIQARDIIVAFNDTPVNNIHELRDALLPASAGDEVVLTIYRGTERLKIPVVLM